MDDRSQQLLKQFKQRLASATLLTGKIALGAGAAVALVCGLIYVHLSE